MKGYPQPLSEAFVYGSPEHPATGSFRWVPQRQAGHSRDRTERQREVPHAGRDKH